MSPGEFMGVTAVNALAAARSVVTRSFLPARVPGKRVAFIETPRPWQMAVWVRGAS